jgi:alpha-beta hydrolase superfamily lysophospholipase
MNKLLSWLKPKVSVERFFKRFLLYYLLLTALVFCFQRDVMYFPKKDTAAEFQAAVSEHFGGKAQIIPGFDAIVVEPAASKGTVIWYHGNGGNGYHRSILKDVFLHRGYRLVLAEYPGYAARVGSPSEDDLVSDAKLLHEEVLKRYPDQPVTLLGESLGSAVATQVAAHATTPPAALVLITPFTNMTDVASRRMRAFPVELLLKDRYWTDRELPGYHGPVHIMVSEKDDLVGAASGLQLYDIAKSRGPADLILLPGATHNSWVFKLSTEQWTQMLGPLIQPPASAP